MKKKLIILLITSLFVFIFISAEPWEGAAAIAPHSELPITGYYVATDSFPGNSVVDITNLETGKSTRAMVSSRLNNPDLLAIISRQAAELIGMKTGSVTSIRMVQVTEPFASMNFSKRLSDGMPEYDSGKVLTEKLYGEDTYSPAPETFTATVPPSYILEPEWHTRDVIVNLEPFSETLPEKKVEVITEIPEEIAEEVAEEPVEIVEAEEIAEETAEEPAELVEAEKIEEAEEIVEEIIEDPVEVAEIEELPEEVAEAIAEEPVEIIAEAEETESTLVLVPAEERPPESLYGINPADIIPGIKLPEPEWSPEAIAETQPPEQPQAVVPAQQPQIAAVDQTFSVPRITELNRGWYYVQIAAFDSPQSVESALRQIDLNYQPVVYKEGDVWYRIMLGPLNQGESAAILQRFKSIGYKDAFVRHIR